MSPGRPNPLTPASICASCLGSTTCEGGAPIDLVDSEYTGDLIPTLGDLYVLPGGIVVVLGVAGDEGSVEWKSPAGGGAFAAAGQGLQSGGLPISTIENYYQADDAVPLGSNDLGVLDGEHNMFADVPLAGGTSPTPVAADSQEDFSHAPLGTGDAPQIGAEATPGSPGEETVVTVGDNENPGDQTVPRAAGTSTPPATACKSAKSPAPLTVPARSTAVLRPPSCWPARPTRRSWSAVARLASGWSSKRAAASTGSARTVAGLPPLSPYVQRRLVRSRRRAVRCDHPSAGRHR